MANDVRARGRIPFNFVDGLKVKGVDVTTITDITPQAQPVGATALVGTDPNAARADHRHAMPGLVTTESHGFMSASDKAKLNGIQSGSVTVTSSAPTAEDVESSAAVGVANTAARADHRHAMPGLVTAGADGFMSAGDKSKLNGIESGAQVNTVTSVAGRTGAVSLVVADISGAAPVASPAFTGIPTAPTPAAGSNTTQIATAAFVNAAADVSSPAGMIAHFARSTAPTGWLKANGQAVIRATYADLFSSIGTTFGSGDGSTTFNLPDLRGEFIRGWDNGRGVDADRVFGSFQTDELREHVHSFPVYEPDDVMGSLVASDAGSDESVTYLTSPAGGSETRPRNRALLACIKY